MASKHSHSRTLIIWRPSPFSAVDTRSFEQIAQQQRPSSNRARNRLCTAVSPWRSCRAKNGILSAWFEAEKLFTGPHHPGLGLTCLQAAASASPAWKQWRLLYLLHVISDRFVPEVLAYRLLLPVQPERGRESPQFGRMPASRPAGQTKVHMRMPWRVS